LRRTSWRHSFPVEWWMYCCRARSIVPLRMPWFISPGDLLRLVLRGRALQFLHAIERFDRTTSGNCKSVQRRGCCFALARARLACRGSDARATGLVRAGRCDPWTAGWRSRRVGRIAWAGVSLRRERNPFQSGEPRRTFALRRAGCAPAISAAVTGWCSTDVGEIQSNGYSIEGRTGYSRTRIVSSVTDGAGRASRRRRSRPRDSLAGRSVHAGVCRAR